MHRNHTKVILLLRIISSHDIFLAQITRERTASNNVSLCRLLLPWRSLLLLLLPSNRLHHHRRCQPPIRIILLLSHSFDRISSPLPCAQRSLHVNSQQNNNHTARRSRKVRVIDCPGFACSTHVDTRTRVDTHTDTYMSCAMNDRHTHHPHVHTHETSHTRILSVWRREIFIRNIVMQ